MSRAAVLVLVVISALGFLMVAGPVCATDDLPEEATGYQESGYDLSTYENINLANGNLTFRVPLYTLRTDGGLMYDMALTHNSKVWGHRTICIETGGGAEECNTLDTWRSFEVADGVETYGFSWDMRPPRIFLGSLRSSLRTPLAWVDASGAKHYLRGSAPWDGDGTHDPCELLAVGDSCFTNDGTNLRLMVTAYDVSSGRPTEIEVDDGHGTVFVHRQYVDPVLYHHPQSSEYQETNFRVEAAGLYVSEIRRGPWYQNGETVAAANVITFEYCDTQSTDPDVRCEASWSKPWMIRRLTATGEVPRSVVVSYAVADGLPDSITIPVFDPAGSGATGVISLGYSIGTFTQDLPDPETGEIEPQQFNAPILERVEYPDGSAFQFDANVPFLSVSLPSGADVTYWYADIPTSYTNCLKSNEPQCTVSMTCGAGKDERAIMGTTEGLVAREIVFHDVSTSGDGSHRTETTYFSSKVNCASDPINGIGEPWPYDFSYALLTDDYIHPFFHYLWTWVETVEGPAWTSLPVSGQKYSAEVHRFHPKSLEEFSTDYVTTVDYWPFPIARDDDQESQNEKGREEFAGVTRHRHVEAERAEPIDMGGILIGIGAGLNGVYADPRDAYLKEERTYSNEDFFGSTDIGQCYAPCDPQNPGSCAESCTKRIRTVDQADQFLNPEVVHTVSTGSFYGLEINRLEEFEYLNETGGSDYWLSLKTLERATEYDDQGIQVDSSLSTSEWRRWPWGEDCDHPGSSPKAFYRLCSGVTGATDEENEPHVCDATDGDCVQHDYRYDDLGNRTRDTVSGGYSADAQTSGFWLRELSTVYDYRYGRPIRKWLETPGGDTRLLWERDVDPGTGLPLWHMSGSGAGFAYLFDEVGKVTDIAPLEGTWEQGAGWSLNLQQVSGPTGLRMMKGTAIGYIQHDDPAANPPNMLQHVVSDAEYSLGGGVLSRMVTGTVRSRFVFDGLGRLTQESEHMPDGTRSRFTLRFRKNDTCDGRAAVRSDPSNAVASIVQSSEWNSGGAWPGSCDSLHWTTSWSDGLLRPIKSVRPDGSSTTTSYRGDSADFTTVYSPDGTTMTARAVRAKDQLDRLRYSWENGGSSADVAADYSYDVNGNLSTVDIGGQHREFLYSDAGWLISSSEPERITTIGGYDALGNPTTETVAKDASVQEPSVTTYLYDDFGRKQSTTVDGFLSSAWTYGDTPEGGGASIGDPDYLQIVAAEQHNAYTGSYAGEVDVTQHWARQGPGGRVSDRLTTVSGVGEAGEGFAVSYGYDPWGNTVSIEHPNWDGSCSETVQEYAAYDGSWLLDADLGYGGIPQSVLGASLTYHTSGRPAAVQLYGNGTRLALEAEWPDPSGMPRPMRYQLTWDPNGANTVLWTEGDYSYDGSGNITAIGSKSYGYDLLGRLRTFSDSSVPPVAEDYTYDKYGNMISMTRDATEFEYTNVYADNRPNRIVQDGVNRYLNWDNRGNLWRFDQDGGARKWFEYSGQDRLMSALHDPTPGVGGDGVLWLYAYDAAGERIARWRHGEPSGDKSGNAPAEILFTLRDEGGRVLSDWRLLPDASFERTTDYLYAGGRLVGQLDWNLGVPEYRFAAVDHLGSTRVLLAADGSTEGLEFAPFGQFLEGGPVPGSTHLFTGHERDLGEYSSGLDYMHARYYSNQLGRFLSVDPVLGEAGSSQSWNRYSYALDSPVKLVDPDGREVFLAIRPVKHTASIGGHSFFVIVPTGANKQHFSGLILPGTNKFTVGGHKRGGRLRTLTNEAGDVASASGPMDDQNQRFLLSPPQGMSMEEFEQAVFGAMMSQDNRFEYKPVYTDQQSGSANCNSLAKGTMDAVGAEQVPPREDLEGWTPGWDDPVKMRVQVVQPGVVRVDGKLRFVKP